MKTMYKGLVNSPETTITNNIGTNDTIIYVLDPARVPSDLPNLMVLGTGTNAETIKVTAIEGNALTVERGFQGIAKDWLAGTIIARNFTEYDYAALVDNINELELTKETPDGAQTKADTAEGNAKTYASNLIGVLSNLKTTVKDKIVSAINELFDNLASHLANFEELDTRVGPLSSLITTIKTSIVGAINSLKEEVNEHKAQTASINAIGHVYAAEFTATLSTSWSGSAAPYTQTVTINGITSAHNPIIDVTMSGTYSTDQQRIEQWGYIYRAVTGTNQITFYASEKPTVSLPIRVKVVR